MPLDDTGLDTALTNLLTGQKSTAAAKDALKAAIINYVKSAQVNVPAAGLVAPNGPVTGQATGTLS